MIGIPSHPRDHPHLLQALPRQSEHQRVELILGQRKRCSVGSDIARPLEAALVESPRSAPDPKAVVHQEPDARRSGIGEQVAVVSVCGPEDLNQYGYEARRLREDLGIEINTAIQCDFDLRHNLLRAITSETSSVQPQRASHSFTSVATASK